MIDVRVMFISWLAAATVFGLIYVGAIYYLFHRVAEALTAAI